MAVGLGLRKGERLELQNVKVVVEKPESYEKFADKLQAVNLDPGRISQYYMDFLTPELRPDETYNYGHRLRRYFRDNNNQEIDAVEVLSARLKKDPEDRKAYFALWDSREDLTRKGSCPCFVSAFFRKFEEKLTLTATFRTHNAMDAWPMNFYGLMAFQSAVAKKAGIAPGAITVISHSISIDPKELDRALMVAEKRKWKMHLDPMGYFRITLDGKEILVEHRFEDVTLKEYRGQDRRVFAAPDRPGRGRLGYQPRHLPGAPTGQGRDGPQGRPGVRAGLAVGAVREPPLRVDFDAKGNYRGALPTNAFIRWHRFSTCAHTGGTPVPLSHYRTARGRPA